MIEILRQASLVLLGVILLIVADAPLRTFGQRYEANRLRERLILLTFEMDLVVLWGLAVFVFHWERRLLSPAAEGALAVLGMVAAIAGTTLAVWARLRLGRWFTGTFGVKEGHQLVTDGPYALSRHPMYTGIVLMVLGAALTWNSLLTLLLGLSLVAPFFLHTVYEETMFEQHFGAAYLDYQRRVPRLLPFTRAGRGAG